MSFFDKIATSLLERLKTIKFTLPSEVHNILGITKEDVESFFDENLKLTPQGIKDAIEDIIANAYETSPIFKKMVNEDAEKDPERLGRATKVVNSFLKYLKSNLPPERRKAIEENSFEQAHQIIKDVLKHKIFKPEEKKEVKEPEIAEITEGELVLFQIPGTSINDIKMDHTTRWIDVKDNILYFLNKLKGPDGKKIKNEATIDMDDEVKTNILVKFLNEIRKNKIKKYGKLSPVDEKWLGKNANQMYLIAKAMASKPEPKKEVIRGEDIIEVNQLTVEVLLLLNRIIDTFKSEKLQNVIKKYNSLLNELLLPVDEFNKYIENIKKELEKLNLSKIQKAALLDVNIRGLSYDNPIKRIKEDKLLELKTINKEIETKGEIKELVDKRKYLEKLVNSLEKVEEKDVKNVTEAINKYLEKLSSIKKKVDELLVFKKIDEGGVLSNFIRIVNAFISKFSKLSKEEIFRARWDGRHGFLFRDFEEKAACLEGVKIASVGSYVRKIEEIKKRGVQDAFDEISDIIDSDDGLLLIREKLLSSLELKPDNVLNVTKKDYTGNPLGGKEISLKEAWDIINRIRTLLGRIDFDKKHEEFSELLRWMASLNSMLVGTKIKKVSFVDQIIKLAKMIKIGEEGEKSLTKDVGRGRPYRKPSEAGWIIFRERLTKLGKKALQSFFEEPTFVQNFVEEMEKEGLNVKLLHGWKDEPMDIEPILEKVIQKTLGKKGNFENILGNKVMQQFRTEFDIKKLDKEIEETRGRIKDISRKLSELEEKYIPKIREFARFLENPISGMVKYISKLREKGVDVVRKPEVKKETLVPINVNRANYQKVVLQLTQKYLSNIVDDVKVAFFNRNDLPSVMVRKYMSWKEDLKKMDEKIKEQSDPYKRALLIKDYYEEMKDGINKIMVYLEDQKDVLEVDGKTIESLEKFLASEEAKKEKEENIENTKNVLSKLKKIFDVQKRYFNYLNKQFSISDLEKMISTIDKNLYAIKDDIKDKEVDMLYQVAISPQLKPTKEEAKEILEKAKEKEMIRTKLIDRDTFRNNMSRLLSYFKTEKFDFVSKEGKPVVLPPERKKELEQSVKEYEENISKIEKYIDYSTKKIALDRLMEKLENSKELLTKAIEKVEMFEKLIQNIRYLEENKDKMTEEEYRVEQDKIKQLLEGKNVTVTELEKELNKENNFIKEKIKEIEKIEEEVKKLKKEVEAKKPPVNVMMKIKSIENELYRLKGIDQPRSTKVLTDEEVLDVLKKKLDRLNELDKIELPVTKGSREEYEFDKVKKEIKYQIESTKKRIEQIGKKEVKKASEEDKWRELSPYERALELKGVSPSPLKELKKPKGWEFVEKFFEDIREKYKELTKLKGDPLAIDQEDLEKRLSLLEKTLKAIEAYKNLPIINIGGEYVAFRDVVERFDNLVLEYENAFRRLVNQRQDAVNKLISLEQQKDYLSKFFDPKTGEFKGFDKEEIDNLKGIFLRMLYRDLERYWATKVGQNLSVFGERATEWYNNVYNTFKNLSKVKSNRKIISLINQYKQEVKADIDDVASRFKVDQLKRRLDSIVKRYREIAQDKIKELRDKKEELVEKFKKMGKNPSAEPVVKELEEKINYLRIYGVDPTKSEVVKDLITRIETLEKQKKQIDRLFNIMGTTSSVALHNEFERVLKEKAKKLVPEEEFKETKIDLEKKVEENVDKIAEELEKNIDDIINVSKVLKEVEEAISRGEQKLGIEKKVEEEEIIEDKIEKKSYVYGTDHPDFNLRILYGDKMQKELLEALKRELNVVF